MQTIKDVQEYVFKETGLKTTVKRGVGSMKGYLSIRTIYQNGEYPKIPFGFAMQLKEQLKKFSSASHPVFSTNTYIDIFGIEDDRIQYKKERKPKELKDMKVREWGSKNSQLRLDKATARNAVKLRAGTTARYY